MTNLIEQFYFREKKREREREELWKRLHELADEIQKSDKHGTIGGSSSLQALPPNANENNQLNSTSASNQNNQAAASAQSHSASAISTQMNSLSISAAAGSMSK
jgi:hypothetical protein